MGDFIGDELPTFTIPKTFAFNSAYVMQRNLIKAGNDWTGPKYKISWAARREMELDKSSTNKNNPRMVELTKFPSAPLPAALPSGLKNENVVDTVLLAQPDLGNKKAFGQKLRDILTTKECEEILKNVFWWFYIDLFKNGSYRVQADVLYNQASNHFAILVMNQLNSDPFWGPQTLSSLDCFMARYSSLLAQLVYSVFCWAYPQSYPKFDDKFREIILQTCSRWVCGIQLSPGKAKSWDLGRLEPDEFRPSANQARLSRDNEKESQVKAYEKRARVAISFAPDEEREVNFKSSVEKLKKVNRLTMRRGTNAAGSLIKKKRAEIPQDVIDSTSGLYEFRKKKFNIAGLSPFLENYLYKGAKLKQGGLIQIRQPLMDRIEISGEIDKKSLKKTLYESRVKLKKSMKTIENCIRDEHRCLQRFQMDNAKRQEEMNYQINTIMKSKSQVHRFCELYRLNATHKNPAPTEKILRSLNNKLLA